MRGVLIWLITLVNPVAPLHYVCMVSDVTGQYSAVKHLCHVHYPGSSVFRQCQEQNVLIHFPKDSYLDYHSFWMDGGTLCPDNCAAVSRNTSDQIAGISIKCLDCNEQHGFICNTTSPCLPSHTDITQTGRKNRNQCRINWIDVGVMSIMISPVRRTLAESYSFCMVENGTDLSQKDALKIFGNVPFPDLKVYWIAVKIGDLNGGRIGIAMATRNTFPTSISLTSQLWLVENLNPDDVYASICVRQHPTATTQSPRYMPLSTAVSHVTMYTTAMSTPQTTSTAQIINSGLPMVSVSPPVTTNRSEFKLDVGVFVHKSAQDGYMTSAQQSLNTLTSMRVTECAIYCNRDASCKSFAFDVTGSVCQLYESPMSSTATLIQSPTAKYFEKK